MRDRRLQSWALLILGLVLLITVPIVLQSGYYVNRTKSMPAGIYKAVDRPLRRGAIVLACLPEAIVPLARRRGYVDSGRCPGGARKIGKYLAGLPGDTVVVTESHVRINGRPLPESRSLQRDSRGRVIRPRCGRYVLEEGQYFVFSPHHPASFDSRYFGPVDSLLTVIEPVLIVGTSAPF